MADAFNLQKFIEILNRKMTATAMSVVFGWWGDDAGWLVNVPEIPTHPMVQHFSMRMR